MRVPRHNFELNDILEALDEPFLAALRVSDKDAVRRAWDTVRPDYRDVIDKEIEHCVTDRRYYLENYHCIRDESGVVKTLYPFWEHQEMVFDALITEYKRSGQALLIVLKPRQSGLTTWSAGVMFHSTVFIPHAFTLSMAQDSRVSLEIYNRMMFSYNSLPWWMRPEFSSKQQGFQVVFQRADEQRQSIDPGLGSTLLVSDAQKSTGVAIGRTVRFAHFSETSRWPDAEVFTADIEPSMNAPDTIAIMESTAYGRHGLFYNMWEGAEEDETGWVPVFIPVYRVRKYVLPLAKGEKLVLTPDEEELRANVKRKENFTIPLTFFKWRRRRVKQTIIKTGREDSHFESYPVTPKEAFISSGYCAFPKVCLTEQEEKHVHDPILIGEITFNGLDMAPTLSVRPPNCRKDLKKPEFENRLWIWEEPDTNELVEYQIAVDASSGDGIDYSDIFVFRSGWGNEPDTQVAEWHGLINPSHLARVAAALGVWYHMAEIACEYQQSGITTGNELLHVLDYPTLYRWKHLDKVTNTTTSYVHWVTTSKTRRALFDRMTEALLDRSVILRNKHLIEEMRDCGREEGDTKVEGHDNNDDEVMSSMISLYTLRERRRMEAGNDAGKTQAQRLAPRTSQIVALFDQFNRQIGQFDSKPDAETFITKMEKRYSVAPGGLGLVIRPIQVMKANTPWSPIYDSQGAEHELHELGIGSRQMMPSLVQQYRDMMTRRHYEGDSE